MLRNTSLIGSSAILQLLIDIANKDEVSEVESGGNEINLSNLFASKKSTEAGYLTSKGPKKDSNNSEKGVKAAKGSDHLSANTRKAFNYLRDVFT